MYSKPIHNVFVSCFKLNRLEKKHVKQLTYLIQHHLKKNAKIVQPEKHVLTTRRLLFNKNPNDYKRPTSFFLSYKFLYVSSFILGTSLGLFFGYMGNFNYQFYLRGQDAHNENANRSPLEIDTGLTRNINNPDSVYSKIPLKIVVYQYETSPYSSQIRAYLDYFGFNYEFIEVDPYSQVEVKAITRRPKIPIVTLEHAYSHRKWYLTNATSIMSVLENLRNEYDANPEGFTDSKHLHSLIQFFLPTLTVGAKDSNDPDKLKFPNKYLVNNDVNNLNAVDWRKWINNTALPILRWNSCDTLNHTFELVDMYELRSQWSDRFNYFKRLYLYYSFAWKMYRESKDFKNMVSDLDPDSFSTATDALNYVIKAWEESLNKTENNAELLFNGKNGPNLADITFFGAIRAFDGCELFREAVEKHEKFYNWYKNMQILVSSSDGGKAKATLKEIDKQTPTVIAESLTQKDIKKLNDEGENTKLTNKQNDIIALRVLSLTYLIHLFAFVYASACKKSN